MNAETKTPELTAEGWVVIRAEYRNDDPAELGLMDDCWHRGAYWRYTVAGLDIREEGSAHLGDRDNWVSAYDRVTARLAAAGYGGRYAKVVSTGGLRDHEALRLIPESGV